MSQCQISSSACKLMALSFYWCAIPDIQSSKILTMKKWMATLYLLLIVWLNTLCVNAFLVMLFHFVLFVFRWLRVLLSPFAPDHIQQSLFHRKGRFTVLGGKLDFNMFSSGGKTERPDELVFEIIWSEFTRILLVFVHTFNLLREERMESSWKNLWITCHLVTA